MKPASPKKGGRRIALTRTPRYAQRRGSSGHLFGMQPARFSSRCTICTSRLRFGFARNLHRLKVRLLSGGCSSAPLPTSICSPIRNFIQRERKQTLIQWQWTKCSTQGAPPLTHGSCIVLSTVTSVLIRLSVAVFCKLAFVTMYFKSAITSSLLKQGMRMQLSARTKGESAAPVNRNSKRMLHLHASNIRQGRKETTKIYNGQNNYKV